MGREEGWFPAPQGEQEAGGRRQEVEAGAAKDKGLGLCLAALDKNGWTQD